MINPLQRPVLSVLTALGVLVLLTLGTWQVQRLQWKEELIATVETRRVSSPTPLTQLVADPARAVDVEYAPAQIVGQWGQGPSLFVTGTYEGAAGYYTFSPFRLADPLAGEGRLLVNRGFVPIDALPEDYQFDVPEGLVTLTGLVRTFDAETGLAAQMAPPPDEGKPIFYRRSQTDFTVAVGESLHPFYLDSLENPEPGAIPLGGTTRIEFSNNHLGYAITWYGLAFGLICVYIAVMRQNGDHSERD